jgi:hypothetical protein
MAERSKFVLWARRDGVTELSASEKKAARRIVHAMSEWLSHPSPTLLVGQMADRVRHIPGLRELAEEIRVLNDWTFEVGGAKYISEALQFNMIVRFLDRFVEREGWYPAKFYKDFYGVKPATLRQHVKRGKLACMKAGTQVLYPFDGVRVLCRHQVTFLPQPLRTGVTKRDKRDKA